MKSSDGLAFELSSASTGLGKGLEKIDRILRKL